MPAYCHPVAFAAFRAELPRIETTPGLFRAAFAIAQHELSNVEVSRAESAIAELAQTVRRRVHSANIEAKLAHLHDVLFDVVGFAGNVEDYYNPANSYLPEVLRIHRGLPITLVLIYKCVAEQIGLTVRGVNSPGHFLAAVQSRAPSQPAASGQCWMYVDPFFGGELLNEADVCRRIEATTGRAVEDASQWLVPATHKQWLARMLNNLQAVFAHAGRERDLYAMQELQELLHQV
ncbi:MAG TPA: transglutaminase-like domain-containing protein [Lacipirellulaceae bacterium]|jgi:regulator of sirC expression with transglutaminase-like and TPR domain|nr:transglutaminase-like domain-containing protein [Lacipirellulaceae bacterium]